MKRNSLSKKLRFEVLKRDSFKCQYCGAAAPDRLLQIDHLNPVVQGGTDDLWNLITSCQPCNSGKSDRSLSDQATIIKAKRQLDELQERREQLEMLMEWQSALLDIKEDAVEHVANLFKKLTKTHSLNAHGKESVRKLLTRHSLELVSRCLQEAAAKYLQLDSSGYYTDESTAMTMSRLGAFCNVAGSYDTRISSEDVKRLYYARGIIRNRMGRYYDAEKAFAVIEETYLSGIPLHRIVSEAKRVNSWRDFLFTFGLLLGRDIGDQ